MKRICLAVLAAFVAVPVLAAGLTPDSPDPYLWLADIHGAKAVAWAKEQTDKTLAIVKADPNYQAAVTPNQQATQNKMAFAALWDPIATQYNLTAYQWNQL